MRPVSARWQSAIVQPHRMVSRARLCTPGQEGTNPGPLADDGEPLYPLAIVDGDVMLSASAEIRSTAQLSVIADWPGSVFDMLNPYGGAELFLERGLVYGSGTREWVSLGYHRIDQVEQRDAPLGPIEVPASDRMAAIIDARLVAGRQFPATWTWRTVIEDLVLEIYPNATITLSGFDADAQIGVAQICDKERYDFLNNIAKAQGCTMFFDYDGSFVMKPVPVVEDTTAPVSRVRRGRDGVLIALGRKLSRESVFNAVVANGEQAGASDPVHAVAYDDNPSSVTRWAGPFGQVSRFYDSSFLRTEAQALAAAQAMLARSIGLPYTVDFSMIPNPALEPLDVIGIDVEEPGAWERHVLDTLTIPLIARRSMRATTRMQPRVVA
jgi:hypothetical protein